MSSFIQMIIFLFVCLLMVDERRCLFFSFFFHSNILSENWNCGGSAVLLGWDSSTSWVAVVVDVEQSVLLSDVTKQINNSNFQANLIPKLSIINNNRSSISTASRPLFPYENASVRPLSHGNNSIQRGNNFWSRSAHGEIVNHWEKKFIPIN